MKTNVNWNNLKEFLDLHNLEERRRILHYGFFSLEGETEIEKIRSEEIKESFKGSHIYKEIIEFLKAVKKTTNAWDEYETARMHLNNRIPLGQQMFSSEEEETLKYHIQSALNNKENCKPSITAIDLILKTKKGEIDFINWGLRWKKIKKDIKKGDFKKLESLLSALDKVGYAGFLLNPEKGLDLKKGNNAAIYELYKYHDEVE